MVKLPDLGTLDPRNPIERLSDALKEDALSGARGRPATASYLARRSSLYGGSLAPAAEARPADAAEVVWHADGRVDVTVSPKRIKREGREVALRLRSSDFRGTVMPVGADPDAEVMLTVYVQGPGKMPEAGEIGLVLPDKRRGSFRVGERVREAVWAPKRAQAHPDPTLADELMFTKAPMYPRTEPKAQRDIKAALVRSRKFVFDTGASARLGEILRTSPELIADYGEFVRLPFPTTWIEFDARAYWHALRPGREMEVTEDGRVGFLYDGNLVYTAAGYHSVADGAPLITPVRYRLHTPMTLEHEQEVCRVFGLSRASLDPFFWGSSYEQLDPSRRRSLRALHTVDFIPTTLPLADGQFAALTQGGGTGDLRILIAAAMLLLRPNLTHVIAEKAGSRRQGLSLKTPKTFMAHTVVTVKLHPEKLVRRIVSAAKDVARAIRWHEVRAHYCHNHAARTSPCIHDWSEVEPNRWECLRHCGGRRWWRAYPDGRGDANVGVVTKHYHVAP